MDQKSHALVSKAPMSLLAPPMKKKRRSKKVFLVVLATFRSFQGLPAVRPIMEPRLNGAKSTKPATRVTGTLFGFRKGKVSLSIQNTSKCTPKIVIELPIKTHVLFNDLGGSGMVRLALQCEKKPSDDHTALLEKPNWTVFGNGKKVGCGVRRKPTEEDLAAMRLLHPVSMGAGVLPGKSDVDGSDGEITYMRSGFDHVVGSRDSETLYIISPDTPNLTIFFNRI